jgi:hypothetical protein
MRTKYLRIRFFAITMFVLAVFLLNSTCLLNSSFAKPQDNERELKLRQKDSVTTWPSSRKRFALVIGVDQYNDKEIGQLKGAATDARTLAKTLEANAGFPAEQIVLLTSDQVGERHSSRANILRELSDLAALVPKDGLLFVAFAGHGIELRQQVFLLPSDAQVKNVNLLEQTAIPATLVADWYRSKVQQVLVVIDACRSYAYGKGSGYVGDGVIGGNLKVFKKLSGLELLTKALKTANLEERNREIVAFAILYASESGGSAYEDTKNKQGYLTSAFIKGIQGEAANKEGDVTLSALVKYVQETVPKLTQAKVGKNQRPFYSVEGYRADELVIAVKKN